LLSSPLQELLKLFVLENGFYGVVNITQFIVGPGLVDKVLTSHTGLNGFFATLGPWNNMVATGKSGQTTKDTFIYFSHNKHPLQSLS
jgi:hypothetical protein